tara:strand:- start:1440 stop:2072 length:633 start_codon:yes stop_codon:yes gene_type:complete
MQTRTYGNLFKTASSLIGAGGELDAGEQSQLSNFINRRFQQAFDESSLWPRYIVIGEERDLTADTTIVPYAESGKDTIGDFISISNKKPLSRVSVTEFPFYVDANGANIISFNSSTDNKAFVTYKKQFTPFTVNADYYNSTVEVPGEFFNFIAHAAYADFLRVQNRQEQAMAEEQMAQGYLFQEMEKIDLRSNNNSIGKKISTYVNRQSR